MFMIGDFPRILTPDATTKREVGRDNDAVIANRTELEYRLSFISENLDILDAGSLTSPI